MSRAQRRHHRARLKKKRRFHWGQDLTGNRQSLSKAARTPCSCSCFMCGNPRRKLGELTMQERKEDEREADMLREEEFVPASLDEWSESELHELDWRRQIAEWILEQKEKEEEIFWDEFAGEDFDPFEYDDPREYEGLSGCIEPSGPYPVFTVSWQ